MWLPTRAYELFHISRDSVAQLREDLAAVRAERDLYKQQEFVARCNFDWIKQRIYQLEVERAQLIEKCYGLRAPVPEVMRAPRDLSPLKVDMSVFEDIGDQAAAELGYPVYSGKE